MNSELCTFRHRHLLLRLLLMLLVRKMLMLVMLGLRVDQKSLEWVWRDGGMGVVLVVGHMWRKAPWEVLSVEVS